MSKGSSGGGAAPGGGSAASSGAQAATPASVASSTHNIKLPKDPKRLSVDQANDALRQMGYKPISREFDLKTKEMNTTLRTPDGKTKTLTSKEIKKLVYGGQAN